MKIYRADPAFKHRVVNTPGGETFKLCYQCGTCTAQCPASPYVSLLRPNKIVELAKLGVRNHVQSNGFWMCAGCNACLKTCPQGVKLPEVMHALKNIAVQEKQVPDIDIDVQMNMPLPLIYSWLCFDPDSFPSNDWTKNEQVRRIMTSYMKFCEKKSPARSKRKHVAIIGSGPAGLACARDLLYHGIQVTMFEQFSKAGGMLRVGLPEHRLPKSLVDAEVQHLLNVGLDLQTSYLVTSTIFRTIDEKFDAVFVASGSHRPRQLRVKGEDLEGVVHAITFLREVALGAKPELNRVVVIGGGGVAVDAARVAVRCGAEVQMFCLEARDELPGHEWELQMAFAEGIRLEPSWGVKEITGAKHVDGLILKRCTQVFDAAGRFHPIYNEDVTKRVDADAVILAIGQSPELSYLEGINVAQGIIIDPYTLQTNRPHVYAGGDAVRGVGSFLEAVLDGTLAAQSIMKALV